MRWIKAILLITEGQFNSEPTTLRAIKVNLQWNGRLFALAYSTAHGSGVDEAAEEDGFEMGRRFTSNKFDESAEELHRLLQAAKK